MAIQLYVTVDAAKQGKFKGEGIDADKGRIPGVGLEYEVNAPRDPFSGQASGKRQHKPVVFTKEWGASSPQFYAALFTNEVLKSVLFEFVMTTNRGEEVDHTIKLTNAAISGVRQSVHNGPTSGPPVDARELQEVTFTFQKIEIESQMGKISAIDDWQTS